MNTIKTPCSSGSKCYRKNSNHYKTHTHPDSMLDNTPSCIESIILDYKKDLDETTSSKKKYNSVIGELESNIEWVISNIYSDMYDFYEYEGLDVNEIDNDDLLENFCNSYPFESGDMYREIWYS